MKREEGPQRRHDPLWDSQLCSRCHLCHGVSDIDVKPICIQVWPNINAGEGVGEPSQAPQQWSHRWKHFGSQHAQRHYKFGARNPIRPEGKGSQVLVCLKKIRVLICVSCLGWRRQYGVPTERSDRSCQQRHGGLWCVPKRSRAKQDGIREPADQRQGIWAGSFLSSSIIRALSKSSH